MGSNNPHALALVYVYLPQALADGRAPSSVYGAEHLARLLSRLPDVMPLAQLTDDQLAHVAAMVQVGAWLRGCRTSVMTTSALVWICGFTRP
jgi:hypothetical protein